jgi:hypothetical protein
MPKGVPKAGRKTPQQKIEKRQQPPSKGFQPTSALFTSPRVEGATQWSVMVGGIAANGDRESYVRHGDSFKELLADVQAEF